jgi:hypothetical protein
MPEVKRRRPTQEQIAATREQRLRDAEAAMNSPIFAWAYPVIKKNVPKDSTIVIPVREPRAPRRKGHAPTSG